MADGGMTGAELRERIKRIGWSYTHAAEKLGLSLSGLNGQMSGERPVSRQTVLILQLREMLPLGKNEEL